jgi:hypothetical protein
MSKNRLQDQALRAFCQQAKIAHYARRALCAALICHAHGGISGLGANQTCLKPVNQSQNHERDRVN